METDAERLIEEHAKQAGAMQFYQGVSAGASLFLQGMLKGADMVANAGDPAKVVAELKAGVATCEATTQAMKSEQM